MRKSGFSVVLLILVLLLSGCLGSSGLTNLKQDGTIILTLRKGNSAMGLSADSNDNGSELPNPTHIRFRISHDNGYRSFLDVELSELDEEEKTIEMRVPVGHGYVIHAISYARNWHDDNYGHHLLLKWDKEDGIEVKADELSVVTLALKPIELELELPEEVTAGEAFELTVRNVPDFIAYGQIALQTEPFERNVTNNDEVKLIHFIYGEQTLQAKLNAPTTNEEGTMYLNFFVDLHEDFALHSQDYYWNYSHWTSNIALGEPQIGISLKLPEGGIGIDVTY